MGMISALSCQHVRSIHLFYKNGISTSKPKVSLKFWKYILEWFKTREKSIFSITLKQLNEISS